MDLSFAVHRDAAITVGRFCFDVDSKQNAVDYSLCSNGVWIGAAIRNRPLLQKCNVGVGFIFRGVGFDQYHVVLFRDGSSLVFFL